MIMKRIASLALSLALLLGCLPTAMAVEDGPSPWAEEEVSRAVEVGLVPQCPRAGTPGGRQAHGRRGLV